MGPKRKVRKVRRNFENKANDDRHWGKLERVSIYSDDPTIEEREKLLQNRRSNRF